MLEHVHEVHLVVCLSQGSPCLCVFSHLRGLRVTVDAGHTNEKNFVGLSVSHDGYIACGSENNAVYCYHKAVPTPICHHKFGTPGQLDDPSEAHHFVSSVCWSRKNNTMISANSMGNIKVLELA